MTILGALTHSQRLRFLARDSAVYGLAAGLNKALALFTFPLLARHFAVADFGTIDLLNTLAVLLVTLLIFGQDSAAARFYYDTDDQAERRQVVTQALIFQFLVMALLLPPAWIFAGSIAGWFGLAAEEGAILVRLVIAQAPFFVLTTYSLGLLKWTFRRWEFFLVSVGSAVFTLIALFVALALGQLDLTGVFVVYLLTRALFGLLALWLVRGLFCRPRGMEKVRFLLPFAVPFGIICVAVSFLPVLERWYVGLLLGPLALGYFAAGAKVAMLINLPISAIEMSWGPFSLSLHKEADAAETYNTVLKLVCFALFGGVLAITAVADLVVALLGSERYVAGGAVTFALAMGLALQGISYVSSVGIVISKRSYLKLYAYGVMLVVAAAGIPLLATAYGIVGAAWGSLLAMLAKAVVETWLAQRAWPIHWRFGGAAFLAGFTLLVGLVHQVALGSLAFAGVELVPLAGLLLMVPIGWFGLMNSGTRVAILHRALTKKRAARNAG